MVAGAAAAFVRLKFAGVSTPKTDAVTVYAPVAALAVNVGDVATPLAFVVAVAEFVLVPAKVPLAPEAGAVKVTTTPLAGRPPVVTVATRGAAKAVLIVVVCGVPLLATITSVAPAAFVRLKLAGVDTPAAVAVTVYAPEIPLALNTGEDATPLAFVVTVVVFVPVSAKVPLAPPAGAANVTKTPLVGDPPVVTVATRGAAKAVLIVVVCGVPPVAAIAAAEPFPVPSSPLS